MEGTPRKKEKTNPLPTDEVDKGFPKRMVVLQNPPRVFFLPPRSNLAAVPGRNPRPWPGLRPVETLHTTPGVEVQPQVLAKLENPP